MSQLTYTIKKALTQIGMFDTNYFISTNNNTTCTSQIIKCYRVFDIDRRYKFKVSVCL